MKFNFQRENAGEDTAEFVSFSPISLICCFSKEQAAIYMQLFFTNLIIAISFYGKADKLKGCFYNICLPF
jgi:hypothetical protein